MAYLSVELSAMKLYATMTKQRLPPNAFLIKITEPSQTHLFHACRYTTFIKFITALTNIPVMDKKMKGFRPQ